MKKMIERINSAMSILNRCVAALFVYLIMGAVAVAGEWRPSEEFVRQVEDGPGLSDGALEIDSYVRYYYGEGESVERILNGLFILSNDGGRIRIVQKKDMPRIFDGGCNVIRLKYDVNERKVISIFCGGSS